MDYLSWDLGVLTRSTQYANLSIASAHVGLSQPQLSRIIAKLEETYGLTLLDRETKRKSAWTPAALRLAEMYAQTEQNFRLGLGTLTAGLSLREVRVGTLEGLVGLATRFSQALLGRTEVMAVHLDVLDTGPLEEQFAKGGLDLIFHARDMGVHKHRKLHVLGYQSLDLVENGPLRVHSKFEFASTPHKTALREKSLISNSLHVRQDWLAHRGGTGIVPSAVRQKQTRRKDEVTVVAVANEGLTADFWSTCVGLFTDLGKEPG